jgi:hypothetical protein
MTVARAASSRPAEARAHIGQSMLRETCGLTAALCAVVPVLLPLFQPGVPATHDGFLHVQRIIALEAAIRQGAPFTRWLPDLAYGYGQPLLLYYAPLSYLPALLARALGAGYALSFQIAEGLALVLATAAMYAMARALVGPLAACVAAAVYGLLPYQLVDVYVRGALAESWAFVWLPLGSWCLTLAYRDGRRRWSVGLALALAGLVLTHNVTALLFLPALLVLAAVLLLTERRAGWRADSSGHDTDVPQAGSTASSAPWPPTLAVVWPIGAALALGLALSAWFWLPALAERGLVQITETLEPDLFASYLFRSWPPFQVGPLFDYERPVSIALGSPIYWPQLGLVQVVVSLAGLLATLRARGPVRAVAVWAVLLVAGGMMLQAASLARLYDLIPLLAFVQFPWRWLALVGLGSAILAAVLVESASRRPDFRAVLTVLVIGSSLTTAVARLHPDMTPVDEQALSTETINRIELADYGLGSTHSGEYLPVTSGQRNAARFRKTMLDAGSGQVRAGQARPSDLSVENVDWRPDRIAVDVEASAPDRLAVHQFAFPGWSARVDGAPAAVQALGQLGLLGVDVPPGRHTVELTWGLTSLRGAAAAISLLAVLLMAVLGGGRVWPLSLRPLAVGVVVAGALGALLLADWTGIEPSSRGTAPRLTTDTLALTDVRTDSSRLASDRLALVRLTWLVRRPPTAGYDAVVEVQSANGATHRAAWTYEPDSRLWERGELVPTTIAVRLPPDFPSGEARLRLTLDRPDVVGPVELGTLAVPALRSPSSGDALGPSAAIGSDLRVGLAPTRPGSRTVSLRARPGNVLDVPLRWEVLQAAPNVDRELVTVAVLAMPAGDLTAEPGRPGDWFSPMPFWQLGEVVEQRLRIAVPSSASPGSYPLSVRVYARDLARGGAVEPGASSGRLRGRPIAEPTLGEATITP